MRNNNLSAVQRNKNGYVLYRGVPVSQPQLRIAARLQIPEKHINFQIGPYFGDLVYPRHRIVIEYDGRYWHQNDSYKAWARTGYLLEQGWKLIIIKSRASVPTMAQLKQALYNAKQGHRYQEIVLADWQG